MDTEYLNLLIETVKEGKIKDTLKKMGKGAIKISQQAKKKRQEEECMGLLALLPHKKRTYLKQYADVCKGKTGLARNHCINRQNIRAIKRVISDLKMKKYKFNKTPRCQRLYHGMIQKLEQEIK